MIEFETNFNPLDIQSLKTNRRTEKQHCSRKICENNKKSFITKEVVQIDSNPVKKSKSTRPTHEYKLNKEDMFIGGELKPERTQGAIFIEKLGQFTLKTELVKSKTIDESATQAPDRAEILMPVAVETQKDAYEFMIFEDDFKKLLESEFSPSIQFLNNFVLFLVERLEVICEISLNKLYKSIFAADSPSSYNPDLTENTLSKAEIINGLMPIENETFKKYLLETSFLDMLLDLIFEQLNEIIEAKLKFFTKTHKTTANDRRNFKINEKQFPLNETSKQLKINVNGVFTFNKTEEILKKNYFKKYFQSQRDFIDNLLEVEMRRDENKWCEYEEDENETKLVISDLVFDYLVDDVWRLLVTLKL